MEQERLQRYKQKMNFIIDKLESIPESIKTKVEINATLYCIQVAIDAAMDIVAMLVKDIGNDVSDDYHNLSILEKYNVISATLNDKLKRFNGLRNAIVHKYNTFEEESVLENLDDIKASIENFLDTTEAKIHDINKKDKEQA